MPTSFAVDVRLNMLSEMARGTSSLNSQLGKAQRQAEGLAKSYAKMFVFQEMEKGGKATLGFLRNMVQGAMDLQSAMVNVSMATGASVSQMAAMHDLVIKTSQTGLMTATQAGQMAAQISRSGLAPKEIAAILPSIAKFANVMHAQRGLSFEGATAFGTELSHLYGAFTAEKSKPIIELAAKAMQMQMGTPQEFYTQLKGFAKVAGHMGMSPQTQMQLASLGVNMGDKSFGVEMMNIMLGSIPRTASLSKHRSDKQIDALVALGIMDRNGKHNIAWGKDGKLDFNALLVQIFKAAQTMSPKDFALANANAFNRRGMRGEMNIADEATMKRIEDAPAAFAKVKSLDALNDEVMSTANAQLQLLGTNLQTIGIVSTDSLIPAITKWSKALATSTGDLGIFINTHKELKSLLGNTVLTAGGIAAALVAVGTLGTAVATMKVMAQAFSKGAMPVYVINQTGGMPGTGAAVVGGTSIMGKLGAAAAVAGQLVGALGVGYGVGRLIGEYAGGDKLVTGLYESVASAGQKNRENVVEHEMADNIAKRRHADGSDKNVIGVVNVTVPNRATLDDIHKEVSKAAQKHAGKSYTRPSASPSAGSGASGKGH